MRFFLFLFLLFPFFTTAVIITEVQIEGEKADECYIKIHNLSGTTVDVSGYNLRKKTSTGTDSSVRVFPDGSLIEAGDYFIWASSRDKNFPTLVGADAVSTQYLSRNNSIALLNKERKLIDMVAWGEGENQYVVGAPLENPTSGQVIKRKEDAGSYSATGDNSSDFYLYPLPTSPLQIDSFSVETAEKKKSNYLLIALFSSVVLSSLVLLLKRSI